MIVIVEAVWRYSAEGRIKLKLYTFPQHHVAVNFLGARREGVNSWPRLLGSSAIARN